MNLGKVLWSVWEKVCLGEFIVFILFLTALVIFILFSQYIAYGLIFAIFFTRYINLYIKSRQIKTKSTKKK